MSYTVIYTTYTKISHSSFQALAGGLAGLKSVKQFVIMAFTNTFCLNYATKNPLCF